MKNSHPSILILTKREARAIKSMRPIQKANYVFVQDGETLIPIKARAYPVAETTRALMS